MGVEKRKRFTAATVVTLVHNKRLKDALSPAFVAAHVLFSSSCAVQEPVGVRDKGWAANFSPYVGSAARLWRVERIQEGEVDGCV